jgi:hypothetical protein
VDKPGWVAILFDAARSNDACCADASISAIISLHENQSK